MYIEIFCKLVMSGKTVQNLEIDEKDYWVSFPWGVGLRAVWKTVRGLSGSKVLTLHGLPVN
jgi:hypothetical protein